MPNSKTRSSPDFDQDARGFAPLAALAALAVPGAGQIVRGEVARGLLAGFGVLFLFFNGLFVGGIDAIDSRENRLWFFGQACVGPIAFGVDHYHQSRFKIADASGRLRPRLPDENPGNIRSLGKMGELGTLSATLAGMMNLIVILDAAFPSTRRKPSTELNPATAR
jgi:hypothetical protein